MESTSNEVYQNNNFEMRNFMFSSKWKTVAVTCLVLASYVVLGFGFGFGFAFGFGFGLV